MANITTQTIRVDLSTDKVIPSAFTHQNDTARTLVFDMYNGGMPYTMTGNTVKFAYKSPIVNGQYSVIAGASMASGTVSGNKVSVTLPVAYTQISGVGMLTMIITPTSGTVRPVNIRLVVQKSADGANEIAGSSDFPTELQEYADAWMDENVRDITTENTSRFAGYKVSIIGDSISTYNGEVYGDYHVYYPKHDVTDSSMCWWKKVLYQSGAVIEVNASYSGSCASNIRSSEGYPSFYDRVGLLGNPDLIYVELGTNDNTKGAPVGVCDFDTDYTLLSEDTFCSAYIKGVKGLQATYPNAEIVLINVTSGQYSANIKRIGTVMGLTVIDASTYDKASGVHPSKLGMRQIASTVMCGTDSEFNYNLPADSKAVGDEFDTLRQMLGVLTDDGWDNVIGSSQVPGMFPLEDGSITPNLGIDGAWSGLRCRTAMQAIDEDTVVALGDPDYRWCVWTYATSSKTSGVQSLTQNQYISSEVPILIHADSSISYFRVAFWRTDGAPMTTDLTDPTSDYSVIRSKFRIYHRDSATMRHIIHDNELSIATGLYTKKDPNNITINVGGIAPSTGKASGTQWNPYRLRTGWMKISNWDNVLFVFPSGYRVTAWTYSVNDANTGIRCLTGMKGFIDLPCIIVRRQEGENYLRVCFEHPDRINGHEMTTDPEDATSDYSILKAGCALYAISDNLSVTDMTGLELLGVSSIAPQANVWISSMTFVGDKLWLFSQSSDDHSDTANINVMSYDLENYTLTGVGKMTHNFGHCNTVDYCQQNDTLILGNGGNSSNTENDQIYIIQNASGLYANNANLVLSDVALIIDLDELGLDWGKQVNVCWAYANYGRYDLAYVLSNDGVTQKVRLIQLGKGSNSLTYGTAVTATDSEFNGTFNVIREWERPYNNARANNDTQLYRGHLWEASGHDGIHCDQMTLYDDESIGSHFMKHYLYGADGSQLTKTTEGIALKDGVLLLGNATDKKVMFFAVD